MSDNKTLEKKPRKRWYVIQTYTGQEKKVKEDLESRIKSLNVENDILRVFIPIIKKIEVKEKADGTKVQKELEIPAYPGYVFVKMIVNDESWFIVRNTPNVTGFLGSSGGRTLPVPLPRHEIEAILKKYDEKKQIKTYDHYVGTKVTVSSGPFKNISGEIFSVNNEKEIAVIEVDMFGRTTQIEVEIRDLKLI